MSKLTPKQRKAVPISDFTLPGKSYPIEDKAHARMALSDIAKFGDEDDKQKVRRKVKKKFPEIAVSEMGGD